MKTFQGLLAAIFLFGTLIVINILQTLSLVMKPFSSSGFRRFNRSCADIWWGLCDWLIEKLQHVRVIVTGDDLPVAENAVVVLNHQVMTDIPVLFSLAKKKERLGDLKWFVKDIFKYVPGVGWGMLFLDCLFIKRNWLADQGKIHRVFQKIINHSIPLWLVSFVEGTRLTPLKLKRGQDYAKERGLVPLRHLLVPRTKGFVASVDSLRAHIGAVYDLTIGYVNGSPTLWQWAKGEVRTVHLHVRRFPVEILPRESAALARWLQDLFVEKDDLLDYFYRNGKFTLQS